MSQGLADASATFRRCQTFTRAMLNDHHVWLGSTSSTWEYADVSIDVYLSIRLTSLQSRVLCCPLGLNRMSMS